MRRGARIIVADDDPEMLSVLVAALRQAGAEVVRAPSGAELADALARHTHFDLVISDVAMPWMTGIQVARAVRAAGRDTPVLVITGMRHPNVDRDVQALGGATRLLHKPFTLGELHEALDALLPDTHTRDHA